MKNEKIHKNYWGIAVLLGLAAILYFTGTIWGEIGLLRDEFGITGEDGFFTFWDQVFLIYIPLCFMVWNMVIMLMKQPKKGLTYFTLALSVVCIAIAAVFLLRMHRSLEQYESLQTVANALQNVYN